MAAAKKFAEKFAIYDGSTNTVLNADEGSDMGLDDAIRSGNGITGRRSPANPVGHTTWVPLTAVPVAG